MSTFRVGELRLTAFRSFRGETLPLNGVTVLTGRNDAGKTNALDGLQMLAQIAGGEPLRGDYTGYAPWGQSRFALGCTLVGSDPARRNPAESSGPERSGVRGPGAEYAVLQHEALEYQALEYEALEYEVELEVAPRLRIVRERLGIGSPSNPLWEAAGSPVQPGRLTVRLWDGDRTLPHTLRVDDDRSATGQLRASALPPEVRSGTRALRHALRAITVFDPDTLLKRPAAVPQPRTAALPDTALDNLLGRLQSDDPARFRALASLVRTVIGDAPGQNGTAPDTGVPLETAPIFLGRSPWTPSDGVRRFTGLAAALLSAPTPPRPEHGTEVLIIEELERGIHPAQARLLLDLVRDHAARDQSVVIVTTHSPAVLDATETDQVSAVLVCHRDPETGLSRLSRLGDLPDYLRSLTEGSVGTAISTGKLLGDRVVARDHGAFERLIGLR